MTTYRIAFEERVLSFRRAGTTSVYHTDFAVLPSRSTTVGRLFYAPMPFLLSGERTYKGMGDFTSPHIQVLYPHLVSCSASPQSDVDGSIGPSRGTGLPQVSGRKLNS